MGKDTAAAAALMSLLEDAAGKEHPDLDFKRDLNLANAPQRSEFAKDVAAQANLTTGGSIVYGADEEGRLVGLPSEPDVDQAASVLANRLQFAPPGIDLLRIEIASAIAPRLPLALWVRVPANPYTVGTCFLSPDGSWKMPIRLGSVTKYLSPAEAMSQHLQKTRGIPADSVGKHASVGYKSDPDEVPETLDSNLLPVVALPPSVWVARTDCRTEGEVKDACGSEIPPFRVVRGRLYSLRPGSEAQPAFSAALVSRGGPKRLQELLRQRADRRMVIGLLNAEVGRYALRKGLVSEVEGRRLYFPPADGGTRTVSWQSFTKKATREVVGVRKKPDGSVDHWFHFAIGLQLQDLRDRFALLLNPSWVFTYDGQQQLRAYEVAPVATPRMNLEDNARILYNTQFWATFLAGSGRRIEVPLCDGPLVISTDTVKIRVPFGIATDRIHTSPTTPTEVDQPPAIIWQDVAEVEDEIPQELQKWN